MKENKKREREKDREKGLYTFNPYFRIPSLTFQSYAETGTHRRRFGRTDTAECWWCASGELQSRHHLFTRCPAWRPQTRRLWKDVGEALEWDRPRAPSVRHLWKGKATNAVLEFLRTTRVGCVGIGRIPPEDREERSGEEEGGPGPP